MAPRRKIKIEEDVQGEAWPAVPEVVKKGERPEDWIVEINGERELVSDEELEERFEFPNDRVETEVTIPIEELAKAYNYDPKRPFNWTGESEMEATLIGENHRYTVNKIEFENPISIELLEETGIVE